MSSISRRGFLTGVSAGLMALHAGAEAKKRPNILFAIADDWSWPYASVYGATGLSTPAFDRVAREGCLFTNAFVAAPQCSPNRASILTGRHIWQNEEAGTHGSIFPTKFPVYPDILEDAGYHVGCGGKGWAPGDWKRPGWKHNPAGPEYKTKKNKAPATGIANEDYAANFESFLLDRPKGAPFCYWYGAAEPHRPYEPGSGVRAGKRLEDAQVPPFLPDNDTVRGDILDHLLEVEWFDRHLGLMLARLDEMGELDNTLVIVTGDNGMSFPGAKANLYEYGTRVPLAVRWPQRIPAGNKTDALMGFVDLAPTFLEAAGETAPPAMIGSSILDAAAGGPAKNEFILTGRERHSHARFDNLGYPARAIRTADRLYIRNFKPDRWPAGDPESYHDIDESPSKTYMLEHRLDIGDLFPHSFGKRPDEELFDVRNDPGCLRNLAGDLAHDQTRKQLSARLDQALNETKDPRVLGTGDIFDSYPRMGKMRPELGGFAVQNQYNPKYGKTK